MNTITISLLFNIILIPEFFLGISIIYLVFHCLFLGYYRKKKFFLFEKSTVFLISLISVMLFFLLINQTFGYSILSNFTNSFISDTLSNISKVVICLISFLFFLFIEKFVCTQKINAFEYYIIFMFGILGTFLICTANDLLASYLSIELQGLSFYLLASFNKNSTYSVENGLKYFILGSFASGLFLYGSSMLYGLFGTLNFSDFRDLIEDSAVSNTYCSHISQYPLIFILASLLLKLAIGPFHAWLPDVYEGSPFNSAFFFAAVPKLSILVLFVKIFNYSFCDVIYYYTEMLIVIGVCSIVIGSFGGLEQRKLKSLLAYSSISHMGYLLIVFSLPNKEGFQLGFCYMIIYMISSLGFWMILTTTALKRFHTKKQNRDLTDLVSLSKSNFNLSVSLKVLLLSTTGFPPLIGFFVKINLLLAIIETYYYLIVIFVVSCSVISTFYYIRVIKIVYFEEVLVGKLYHPIKSQIMIILSLLIYWLGFVFVRPNLLFLISDRIIINL
jgi:NADH-quinone oxidoreductase subunit N